MSRFTFEDLQQVMELNPFLYQNEFAYLYGLITEEDVQNAEKNLGVSLPESYRKVILTWGAILETTNSIFLSVSPSINVIKTLKLNGKDHEDVGSFNIVKLTEYLREDSTTPESYIAITDLDDDWCICMDASTPEGVVIDWEYIEGYVEQTLADSFIDFVFERYLTYYRDMEDDFKTTFKWPGILQKKLSDEILRLNMLGLKKSLPDEWY